jgi:hypothetical protein
MSIGEFTMSEASLSQQAASSTTKKPPPKRTITAKTDATIAPEAR